MNRFDATIVGYSVILMIGGVIGYLAAGSIVSLLMSAIFSILLILSLFLMRFTPLLGYRCTLLLISLLTLFFAYRWYSGNRFLPAGLMTIISLIILAATLIDYRKKPA